MSKLFYLLSFCAILWLLHKAAGDYGMYADPYDGTQATFHIRHWFWSDKEIPLRLMKNHEWDKDYENSDIKDVQVWCARTPHGDWRPFFREPID